MSGLTKIIQPYQNFLYIIQSYEFLSSGLAEVASRVVPWYELFVGLFLILGLWLNWALRGFLLLVTGFLVIVSRALIIKLPITDCGCFGEFLHIPLEGVLTFDSCLWVITAWTLLRVKKASSLSLDNYFSKST